MFGFGAESMWIAELMWEQNIFEITFNSFELILKLIAVQIHERKLRPSTAA